MPRAQSVPVTPTLRAGSGGVDHPVCDTGAARLSAVPGKAGRAALEPNVRSALPGAARPLVALLYYMASRGAAHDGQNETGEPAYAG
jgi:hypothetical protein